jgi:transposase
VGQPPVLRRVSRRREVSSVVLLIAPRAGQPARLVARHFLGTIHTAELLAALRYFHAVLDRLVIVVWDHLNVHRAEVVDTFVGRHPTWFRVEWLPGYAPELNPEEQCNQWVKHDMLHALPSSVEELHQTVRGRFIRLAHQPELLRSFFGHAGLGVN